MTDKKIHLRRVRSFVRRDSRMTASQRNALEVLWEKYGLKTTEGLIDFAHVFQRTAPCVLEIGFGSGHSLLEAAKLHPNENFIGIETHKPGIGALLAAADLQALNNIRVFYADAVEILEQCIPDESLDVVQIFFPDPWQKRKHHKRRLIQSDLVRLLAKKVKPFGTLHLATDWENYAEHMMQVLSEEEDWLNLAGHGQFAMRSSQRPVVTKFEERGTKSGRKIWELQFARR